MGSCHGDYATASRSGDCSQATTLSQETSAHALHLTAEPWHIGYLHNNRSHSVTTSDDAGIAVCIQHGPARPAAMSCVGVQCSLAHTCRLTGATGDLCKGS